MQTAKITALNLTLLLLITGCRVTTPQHDLRSGASWFPPRFPYLRGIYQQQLQIQTPTPSVHDLDYHNAAPSSNSVVFVTGAPDHYHGNPILSHASEEEGDGVSDDNESTESNSEK